LPSRREPHHRQRGAGQAFQDEEGGLIALIEMPASGAQVYFHFVSFILGPRINASGRMDTAETSLNLLMTDSKEEAEELARVVEQHNRTGKRSKEDHGGG